MSIRYKITFMPLRGIYPLEVCVYDANYTGSALTLTGSGNPFVTEEDNDEDFFLPVRSQSGYLTIVDDGKLLEGSTPFYWESLIPDDYIGRPVVLRNATTLEKLWCGFVQHQQPDYALYDLPAERSYAVYDLIGACADVYFSVDIDGASSAYMNFAAVIKKIIDSFPAEVRPQFFYFQDSGSASYKLLSKVNPQLFHEIKNTTSDNLRVSTSKYTCQDVLSEIGKFWGWSFRTCGNKFYATQDYTPHSEGHSKYLQLAYNQLTVMAAGTHSGTQWTPPTAIVIDGSELVSRDNNLHSVERYDAAEVEADAEANTELVQLYPDSIRKRLANSSFNNERNYIYSTGSIDEYKAAGHRYADGNGIGMRLYGFPVDGQGGVDDKVYNYLPGTLLKQSSAGVGVVVEQLWPGNFADCQMKMSAAFYGMDGKALSSTDDSYDSSVGSYDLTMEIDFYDANGDRWAFTPDYYAGSKWTKTTVHTTFIARVGNGSVIPVVNMPERRIMPTINFKRITKPVGRLVFTIYGIDAFQAIMTQFNVTVERQAPPTIDVNSDNNYGGYPLSSSVNFRRTLVYSVDTIFASDNYNEFGLGTVLAPDNTPLTSIAVPNALHESWRPEEWVRKMVLFYYELKRMAITADLRHDLSKIAAITPASRITFKGMLAQPVSISYNWRDNITTVVAMEINTSGGPGTCVVTPVAGTGIRSVSGGGLAYVGDPITVSCEVEDYYIFSHWEDEQSGAILSYSQTYTIPSASDMTVMAVAVEDTRKFSVTVIKSTGIASVRGAGEYRIGTTVNIGCTTESDYTFRLWTKDNPDGEVVSRSESFVLTVHNDIVLYPYAEYEGSETVYRLFFYIVQPEWGSIHDDDGQTYQNGSEYEMLEDEVRLFTAEPAAGYEFVQWLMNGDLYSTEPQISVIGGSDMEDAMFTAIFKSKPVVTDYQLTLRAVARYTRITVEINNSSSNVYEFSDPTKPVTVTVPANAPVKLTASYNGFDPVSFVGWRNALNPDDTITGNPLRFTMDRDKDITCIYE